LDEIELAEAKIKQILKQQREGYQRYFGVVTKKFTSQVKTIAEILSDVQKQLMELKKNVAGNTEDIAVIRIEISIVK
jgi:hypothetical protein